ncbi:hypothetical protein V8G54_032477 [Vigna mungo]|uniref:Prefoldin subunit 5 n=1 Tax=Vigna mungo TaxID=3915 RepID=A0AAQ3MMY9_VIGMU
MGSWKSGSMGLERMSVEQLKAVKEQSDLEVNLLQDSLNNIRSATTRLEIASSALNDLAVRPPASQILVPLTASLYVPATLHDSTHVLIDVGTGYFIEVKPYASTFMAFRKLWMKEKITASGKSTCSSQTLNNLLRYLSSCLSCSEQAVVYGCTACHELLLKSIDAFLSAL